MLKILLVIGGALGSSSYTTDSTELYDTNLGGSWIIGAALLPNPMTGLRAATKDNRVYIFGIDILHIYSGG